MAGVASDRERLRLIPVGQTPLLVVELQVCSRSLHERYRANSSSRRQSAGSRRSLRLVTQSSSPCCCGGCPYHVDRGAGARPNCRARDATSTSDTDLGSRTTTARPAVACTFIEFGAISPRQRSKVSRRAA